MSWITKIIYFCLKMFSYQYAAKRVRRSGLLFYLKTLQVARKSLALALITFFVFQLMLIGFVGAIISGVWLLPIDDHSVRLWILFGTFSCIFLVPFAGLLILFSDRLWLKISGAARMMDKDPEESMSSH